MFLLLLHFDKLIILTIISSDLNQFPVYLCFHFFLRWSAVSSVSELYQSSDEGRVGEFLAGFDLVVLAGSSSV